MLFTIEDIRDKDLLKKLVDEESNQIYIKTSSRRNRTLEEIRSAVQQGKVAELYLVENFEYEFSYIKYHDLFNKDREIVEVKAYSSTEVFPSFIIKDIRKIQSSDWNKSNWYYYFGYHEGMYNLHQKIKLK
jgi:hypothetical protein